MNRLLPLLALVLGFNATFAPGIASAEGPRAPGSASRAAGAVDWLLNPAPFVARVTRSVDGKEVELSNGLVRRVIRLQPNAATVALDNLMTGAPLLRAVRPEARVELDGVKCDVGDQLHPRGRLEAATYDLVGGAYALAEELEPWCLGTEPLADVGIVVGTGTGPGAHARTTDCKAI